MDVTIQLSLQYKKIYMFQVTYFLLLLFLLRLLHLIALLLLCLLLLPLLLFSTPQKYTPSISSHQVFSNLCYLLQHLPCSSYIIHQCLIFFFTCILGITLYFCVPWCGNQGGNTSLYTPCL